MKTLAPVFSPLLFGALAATAHATTTVTDDVPFEVVSYADLNLANEADAAILLQRVTAAAHRVCSRDVELLPLDLQHPVQRCAKAATARAMADVESRSTLVAYVRR
ncbi:MAG TPA: UrcA family protein [Steroidobacteraceae bacterium]|jgi:UrcA family protein|nr:UrcA family protein [Steroidobacteraceae bacterium]